VTVGEATAVGLGLAVDDAVLLAVAREGSAEGSASVPWQAVSARTPTTAAASRTP
jgi:hypothetical protein